MTPETLSRLETVCAQDAEPLYERALVERVARAIVGRRLARSGGGITPDGGLDPDDAVETMRSDVP